MVEAMANSVEDRLIDGLSFKLAPGASYITDRRSVTFHPQGSNIYKPGSGTRVIKLLLTGDSWLDPSTFRVMFDLKNNGSDAQELRPLGGPWSFFRRMRVLCGGQIIEDIDNYGRTHQMMHLLTSKHSRENDMAEAFGQEFDMVAANQVGDVTPSTFRGIAAGEHQTVMFKPLSGLLNQNKYLPIRYCPLTIELEIVDSMSTPVLSKLSDSGDTNFTAVNTSVDWEIMNVQVKCDLCTLDNALDNSYAEHLLSGKSLPINYNTMVTQVQTITGQVRPRINVTRALTRLKSVFVTLDKDLALEDTTKGRKDWNDFFSPLHLENQNGDFRNVRDGEFEFQLQIGSKLFPEYPIRSHAEAYYQLKKTLGVQASALHNFDITPTEYRDYKMILAIDTEKVLEAGYTGLNTRAGDLLNIDLKYNSSDSNRLADRLHVVLHSDQIMEIRDTGVTVFD
jgi:hypothetical protein